MEKKDYIIGLIELGYDVLLFDVGRDEMRKFRRLTKKKGQEPEQVLINIIKRYNEQNSKK